MAWLTDVPLADRALVAGVLAAGGVALAGRRRGGHFRALPGWAGFWVVFASILVALSRLESWISLLLLGLLMFVGLRTYFFLVPVRPKDRSAHFAAYLSIPVALGFGVASAPDAFIATMPVIVFLLFPGLLALGRVQEGFLDAVGRILLGVLLFVFCTAHLGLMVGWDTRPGVLGLYGLLVLAAELPQRLAGRLFRTHGLTAGAGIFASAFLAGGAGWALGPSCGLREEDGFRAALLVVVAVTLGAVVGEAIQRDLGQSPSDSRLGRSAFLDRSIPAIYAAPVYFHYLNHFL
jgi:predicted CDP-diglyceride synthetase/phosphatidate cytidylyltransferase